MPKIARFGGPSWEGHEGVAYDALDRPSEIDPDHQGRLPLVGEPTEDVKDEDRHTGDVRRKEDDEQEGGEDESAGTSSSTSNESDEKTEPTSSESPRSRVRATESRSK